MRRIYFFVLMFGIVGIAYSAKQDEPAKPQYLKPANPSDVLKSGANADLIRCFESIHHFNQSTATGGAALADGIVYVPGLRAQMKGLYAFTADRAVFFPVPEEGYQLLEIRAPSGQLVYVSFAEVGPDEYQIVVRDTLLPENHGRAKRVESVASMDLEARTALRRLLKMAITKSFASFDSRVRLAKADPRFADVPSASAYVRALDVCDRTQDVFVRESVKAEKAKFAALGSIR